jgi:hypothetical protein
MISLQHNNGKFLDLPPDFSIPIEHKNNVFDWGGTMQGDRSYSFNIPDTPNNKVLFRYVNRIDAAEILQIEQDFNMFIDNIFYASVKVGLNSYTDHKFSCYMLIGKASIYTLLQKKISDIALPNYNFTNLQRVHGWYIGHRSFMPEVTPTDFNITVVFFAPTGETYTLDTTVNEVKAAQASAMATALKDDFDAAKIGTTWLSNFEFQSEDPRVLAPTRMYLLAFTKLNAGFSVVCFSTTHQSQYLNNFSTTTDKETLIARSIFIQFLAAYCAFFCTNDNDYPFSFLPIRNQGFDDDDSYKLTEVMNPYKYYRMDLNHWEFGGIKHFVLVPFFSYKWLLEQAFDYIEANSPFKVDRSRLVHVERYYIYNVTAIDSLTLWNTAFNNPEGTEEFTDKRVNTYSLYVRTMQHVPDITLSELLNEYRKLFCCRLNVNLFTNTITFTPINDSLDNENVVNITNSVTKLDVETEEDLTDLGIRMVCDPNDPACENIEYELQVDENEYNTNGDYISYDLDPDTVPSQYRNTYVIYQNRKIYKKKVLDIYKATVWEDATEMITLEFLGYKFTQNKYPLNKTNYIDIKIGILNDGKYETWFGFELTRYDQIHKAVTVSTPVSAKKGIFPNMTGAVPSGNYMTLVYKAATTVHYDQSYPVSVLYRVARTFNLSTQSIYDSSWKRFLQLFKGKSFKLKCMLSRTEYEKLLNEGVFRIANNNFIFKELDINITNQSVQNVRYEAIITAYRLS